MTRHSRALATATTCAAVALTLAGCSSGSAEAAQAVYDACAKPDMKIQLLRVEGSSVLMEIKGENAKALSGADGAADAVLDGSLTDGHVSGLVVSAAVVIGMDCLVEETGFPGSSDQIKHGDEWDGWRYEEKAGAGSEFSFRFTSTS